jgi:hypothetical protein
MELKVRQKVPALKGTKLWSTKFVVNEQVTEQVETFKYT